MRRAATLVTALMTVTASAAWAAYSALPMDDLVTPAPGAAPKEIVIKVAPEDLARCRATLMQVMQPPVDPKYVTEVRVHGTDSPTVRCEAE